MTMWSRRSDAVVEYLWVTCINIRSEERNESSRRALRKSVLAASPSPWATALRNLGATVSGSSKSRAPTASIAVSPGFILCRRGILCAHDAVGSGGQFVDPFLGHGLSCGE